MQSGPQRVVVSGRLRVVFERQDDRWGHRVEWRAEDERFVPLIESMEGSPHEEDVPSPPMQEVTMQRLPDGIQVALGVGTAGPNHWSIAFAPAFIAHAHSDDNYLAFALACRLREHAPELRSSYRVIPPLQEMRLEPRTIALSEPDVQLRIDSDAELRAIDGGFAIVVSTPSSRRPPCTEKWSYGLTAIQASGD